MTKSKSYDKASADIEIVLDTNYAGIIFTLGSVAGKDGSVPVVPEWPEFIRGCVRYRQSLDEQASDAQRTNEPYKE